MHPHSGQKVVFRIPGFFFSIYFYTDYFLMSSFVPYEVYATDSSFRLSNINQKRFILLSVALQIVLDRML